MKLSCEDLLSSYVSRLIEDEEARVHIPDPLCHLDIEKAGLFALLMVASYLDSIDTRLLALLHSLENPDERHTQHR